MRGHELLAQSLKDAAPSVVPYLTAGYPDMATFVGYLRRLRSVSPAVEVGIPFSDPMADGTTIQDSSQQALAGGATLRGILEALGGFESDTPLVAMTYLNPLLAFGLDEVMAALAAVGVASLVIPDLPYEESTEVGEAAARYSVGLVQLVTPLTDGARLETLCSRSQGFVYAVTMTGTTGGAVADTTSVAAYLDKVRSYASVPVLAGFGIRDAQQVRRLAEHCDGVIVGSAIVEKISRGEDPVEFVEGLKA
jgi:tryptophan synthase alpha chain